MNREDPNLNRISAFSDGVFAFAITLLVLTIRIPRPSDADASLGLLALLTQQWRSCLVYALSFMNIGIHWTNHRIMFSAFARSNHVLTWLNLIYLMVGVAFVPVPTAVLGAWLGDPHNQMVAAVFYGTSAFVGGVAFNIVWWYGAYVAKFTFPTLTASQWFAHTTAWAPAPIVALLLTAVAFVNPPLSVVGFLIFIFVYVLPLPRLLARARQRRPKKVEKAGESVHDGDPSWTRKNRPDP